MTSTILSPSDRFDVVCESDLNRQRNSLKTSDDSILPHLVATLCFCSRMFAAKLKFCFIGMIEHYSRGELRGGDLIVAKGPTLFSSPLN